MSTVLVTGGAGFVGTHVILALLQAGHTVCTTVRDLKRQDEVRTALRRGGVEAGGRLSFIATDLMKDDNWAAAMQGCDYVHHVASPLPVQSPKDENEVIGPAREGTLRVLRFARAGGIKRVIVTSSFAAIGYGHPAGSPTFDETSWTDPTVPGLSTYVRSKALAERAAWDFMAREGGSMEMVTINPTAIFGPVLSPTLSGSITIIKMLLNGKPPVMPRISMGVVDVRDVADLHVRAMTAPAAAGQRFLCVSGKALWLREVAEILKENLGPAAAKVKTSETPSWLLKLLVPFVPVLKEIGPELDKLKNSSNAKAVQTLGWQPRPAREAVIAAAKSLQELNLI
jgi:nucleoside-diphosphate-sugar epimerase